MAEESIAAHTTQDIWQEISKQAGIIGEVRSAQASTETRLDSIEHSVDSGFRNIATELQRISGRVYAPPKEISPTAIIGASAAVIFGVLGMFGAYTILITSPIKEDVKELRIQLAASQQLMSDYAGTKATVAYLITDLQQTKENYIELFNEVHNFQKDAHYIHGQREELGKRVEDIDNKGSRVWNSGPAE
jgi:predicted  nucleic acid-binding Zn-ribbon protein